MEYKSRRARARALRLVTATVAVAIILTVAAALLPTVAAEAATTDATFKSRLATADGVVKFTEGEAALLTTATRTRTETPIVVPKTTVTRTSTGTGTSGSGSSGGGEDPQAILARYIARYPILAGATVSYGDAKGHQAIAYYTSGRIVISTSHTASLDRIIGHEIWHVIDWRDNGVIDWGENVPPR